MLVDLALVKTYLRLDQYFHEEDQILTLMIDNAETYIVNAVGEIDPTNVQQTNQVKLLSLVLITDFYENRELTGKLSEKVRGTVNSILTQLKYCYDAEVTV